MTEAGYRFTVVEPEDGVEQDTNRSELPPVVVAKLALDKAANVAGRVERGIVIGCDTVAECKGEILNKPADQIDARRMLELLNGREHRVYSGLCLWRVPGAEPVVRVARTVLRMTPLAPAEINDYLASGLWQGKSGAFGYQDRLGWLTIVEGSESNVVGLPMELLAEMLTTLSDTRP
jgi:septum formation protein